MKITERVDDFLLHNSATYAGRRAMRAEVPLRVASYLLTEGGKNLHERTSLDRSSIWLTRLYTTTMRAALDGVVNGNLTYDAVSVENERRGMADPNSVTPRRRSYIAVKELDHQATTEIMGRPGTIAEDTPLHNDPRTLGLLRNIRNHFQESAGQAYLGWIDRDPGLVIPEYPAYPDNGFSPRQ